MKRILAAGSSELHVYIVSWRRPRAGSLTMLQEIVPEGCALLVPPCCATRLTER